MEQGHSPCPDRTGLQPSRTRASTSHSTEQYSEAGEGRALGLGASRAGGQLFWGGGALGVAPPLLSAPGLTVPQALPTAPAGPGLGHVGVEQSCHCHPRRPHPYPHLGNLGPCVREASLPVTRGSLPWGLEPGSPPTLR